MITPRDSLYVLTGGPGSGKSTLITALAAHGIACLPETGRSIIRTQRAIGGRALPWADPALFAEMELAANLLAYEHADPSRLTIADRGIPDALGYLTVTGLAIPAHMREAVRLYRYAPVVFLAPPWAEIYENDGERAQDFALARATHDAMVTVYGDAGYRLVTLPLASVAERVAMVLETLGASRRASDGVSASSSRA